MPPFPVLEERLSDGVVELRLAADRDIPETLIAHQDDSGLHLALGMDRPPSGAELGRGYEQAPAEREAGTSLKLSIVEPGSDDCRGQLDVHNVRWDQQRAELGIWVAPQVRGRGYATRALRLAAGWLFDVCGFERLALLTESESQEMLGAARAAGFVQEGVLRSYGREHGRRIDLVSLSLVLSDR
jgi:RimJ/RimL family protein N-acetyltransferase